MGNCATNTTWFVYIAECCDGTLYTGVAKDVTARLRQHNSGAGARYTRSRLPLTLLYTECSGDQGSALRREAQIKRLPRRKKLDLIASPEAMHDGRRCLP